MNLILIVFLSALMGITNCTISDYKSISDQRDAIKLNKDHSLVLVPTTLTRSRRSVEAGDEKHQKKYQRLAHSVHVQSDIRFRYATTLITNRVYNPEETSREVFLTVILPETAFISRFAIEVDGQLFVAYVKEKEAAWREYQEAISEGKTAGHVGISARHSNQFRVSVNTQKLSGVNFFLVYEELLHRTGGLYEHTINITPRQKLKDFLVEVFITENRNLTHVEVPSLRRHEIELQVQDEKLEEVDIKKKSPNQATIRYRPDIRKLQHLLQSKFPLQFAVIYDVERTEKGGEVQVLDGYFVHFVAPENLPPMPKHVVFILDTSGSMQGKKLLQTQNAMTTILKEMRSEDYMTIIDFADDVIIWSEKGEILQATPANIDLAINYVQNLEARGGTNINEALLSGLNVMQGAKLDGIHQSMIFFLTDGHATTGETDNQVILSNVKEANTGNKAASIFSLAFGRQADFDMLKILSLQHHAFARKIYIAADASLQLAGFYKEVSSPILKDVQFDYPKEEVVGHTLTSTNFYTYYQGSEMVVAGHLTGIQNDAPVLEYEILATQAIGEYKVNGKFNSSLADYYPQTITETVLFEMNPQIKISKQNVLERLWAYLTIQDLLRRVARGDFNSCPKGETQSSSQNLPKPAARVGPERPKSISDDEDYYYDDNGHGSGDRPRDSEDPGQKKVEDIMEEVGDAEIIICDNLERALYLSLKYEFVTPLTSLVVVKPDALKEDGNFGNADESVENKITFRSGSPVAEPVSALITLTVCFLLSRNLGLINDNFI